MKKFTKKIVILIALGGILISKVYCFAIANRSYCEINDFKKAENRYYAVTIKKEEKNIAKYEIFCKDNKMIYLQFNEKLENIFSEFKNFNTNESCFFATEGDENKILNLNERYIKDKTFIIIIPNLMLKIFQNNKFNLKEFLNIYYVIPVKYEDKKCYKIVTKYETIIIDKETFLPKYSCKNWVNSEDDNSCKMEYFYEFEINTVTEEDMQKL